jgi:hypothetical protein
MDEFLLNLPAEHSASRFISASLIITGDPETSSGLLKNI